MKFATFKTKSGKQVFGVLTDQGLVDMNEVMPDIPDNALDLLRRMRSICPWWTKQSPKPRNSIRKSKLL